jgi:NADH-quinone oxidoreductase subunit M
VAAAIYSLALIQRTFHGPLRADRELPDLSGAPFAVLVSMMILVVWLGWYPMVLFSVTEPTLQFLHHLGPSMPNTTSLQPNGDLSALPLQTTPALSTGAR